MKLQTKLKVLIILGVLNFGTSLPRGYRYPIPKTPLRYPTEHQFNRNIYRPRLEYGLPRRDAHNSIEYDDNYSDEYEDYKSEEEYSREKSSRSKSRTSTTTTTTTTTTTPRPARVPERTYRFEEKEEGPPPRRRSRERFIEERRRPAVRDDFPPSTRTRYREPDEVVRRERIPPRRVIEEREPDVIIRRERPVSRRPVITEERFVERDREPPRRSRGRDIEREEVLNRFPEVIERERPRSRVSERVVRDPNTGRRQIIREEVIVVPNDGRSTRSRTRETVSRRAPLEEEILIRRSDGSITRLRGSELQKYLQGRSTT